MSRTPNNSINRLFVVQKSAVRVICNLSYDAHTSDKFKDLDILKLRDEYVFSIGVRMFKAVNFDFDMILFNNLRNHQLIHNYSTRYNNNYITAQFSRSKSQHSLAFVGPRIWNSFVVQVRHC